MCRLYGKFTSYLRRVLCKTRLIFSRINGPINVAENVATAGVFAKNRRCESPRVISSPLRYEMELCSPIGINRPFSTKTNLRENHVQLTLPLTLTIIIN